MALKRKACTISTNLQAVVVAEKTSKEAAERWFSVDLHIIRRELVMLTTSDNFRVARIVRLLWTTTFPTALYNKKASH